MSLLPFLVVGLGGVAVTLALRGFPRARAAAGVVALGVALVVALGIRSGEVLAVGGADLAATPFLRTFLVLGCTVGLLLTVIAAAAGGRRDVPPLMLGTLTAAALALALTDARIAVVAATAGGALAALGGLGVGARRAEATAGLRGVRAVVVAGALAIAATAWMGRPLGDADVQPVVFGVAYLCLGLGVAIRFGAIPFHAWAARLAEAAPDVTLPILIAWGPAVLAVVGLTWVDGSVAVLAPELGAERFVLVVVALATVVLASFAAWISDDLDHVLAYAIIGDAGIALIGLAALDPEAWAPARVWIVAALVARSAFAGWVAAVRATYGTGRVDDLRGWGRRTPPLLLVFLVVAVAGLGLPGLAAWDARAALLGTVASGPLHGLLLLTSLLPVVWIARLLASAVGRPATALDAEPWLPRWQPVDVTAAGRWLAELFRSNRVPLAIGVSLVLALGSLVTMAGGFGIVDAAAGLAPGFDAEPGVEP